MNVIGRLLLSVSILASALPAAAQAQSSGTPPPTIRIMRVPPPTAPAQTVNPTMVQTMAVKREITPPPEVATRGDAGSVTLKSGPNSAIVRSLVVKRQFSIAQARAMQRVMVGQTEMNLQPTFDNPRALFNVASRVRGQPALAEVVSEDSRVMEVEQGLLIQSFVTYRIKPGVCTEAPRRAALASVGLSCATQITDQTRTAGFANPRDPRYVKDVTARSRAIDEARVKAAQGEADLNDSVAQVRAKLNSPAGRAEFVAALGEAETTRLSALSDDQIKAEIVNSGETSIEQTLFVPRLDRVRPGSATNAAFRNLAKPAPGGAPMPFGAMTVKPSGTLNPGVIAALNNAAPTVSTQAIPEKVFLTGFTLGREYEWKERIEKTIKTCLVSCKKTYYVEVFAGFNYGFGLRFPMKVGGTYTYKDAGGSKSAQVQTSITPINGNEADYLATGLPGEKLFGGKELVAQIGAHAGAGCKLPFVGSNSVDIAVGVDLTEYLPGDFFRGQFTPPTPGGSNNPKAEKFFEEVDLIGGRANFGVIGAQVFPGVRVELTSDKLTFNLHDFNTNADTLITKTGQVVTLGMDSKNQSKFSISDPKYNVAFLITPGLNARLFVDIAVWSHTWNFPVWFPQLALKLPPGGVEFACHEGTECNRTITVSPAGLKEVTGPAGVMGMELDKWGQGFDNKYLPDCADETCRIGIRFVRQGTIFAAMHKFDANNALKLSDFSQDFIRADMDAQGIIGESNVRKTKDISKDYREIYRAIWTKKCSDKICFDKVKGISTLHLLEVNAQQKMHPDWETNQVLIEVLKKFTPVYQTEVDASKNRVAIEQANAAKRAAAQANLPPVKLQ